MPPHLAAVMVAEANMKALAVALGVMPEKAVILVLAILK
jgi:hypothetical protein